MSVSNAFLPLWNLLRKTTNNFIIIKIPLTKKILTEFSGASFTLSGLDGCVYIMRWDLERAQFP